MTDDETVRGHLGMKMDCPVHPAESADNNNPDDKAPGIWLDWIDSEFGPLLTVGLDDGEGINLCGYLGLDQAAAFSRAFVQVAQMAALGVKRETLQ